MKKLLKVLNGHLIVIVLRLVSLLVPIKIGYLRDDRIGHLAGEMDLFLRRRELGETPDDRTILITAQPCNSAIVDVFKRYLPIFRNRIAGRVLQVARPWVNRAGFERPIPTYTSEYEEFAKFPATLSLTDEEERRGREELSRMGVSPADWFVCFHARDPAYLAAHGDFSYHDFRDSSIAHMIPAMGAVTARGGFAIRMGAAVAEPLGKLDDDRIIDYATRFRTDFMDVFLSARCRFFIGNTSGLFHVPKAFGRPYAMVNVIGYVHLSPQPQSLLIPKLLRDTATGRILTFPEMQARGLFDPVRGAAAYLTSYYADQGLDPVENTPEDLLGVTEDMFDMDGGKTPETDIRALQTRFKDTFYPHFRDRHYAGDLAPSFIRSHRDLLFPERRSSQGNAVAAES